jgi:hypothetical protein
MAAQNAVAGCGGRGAPAESAAGQSAEERQAQRLLADARASKAPDRYREIILDFGNTNAAAAARSELADLLVVQAERALPARQWDSAEELAEEAKRYGNVATTQRARAVLDQIDDGRAAEIARVAQTHTATGDCDNALRQVAEPLRKKPRARFREQLQKLSEGALVDCLMKKLEAVLARETVEVARSMLETPDATTALTKQGYDLLHAALHKSVVQRTTVQIRPLLTQKKWLEAIAKLGGMKSTGALDDQEYALAFVVVQDAIVAHLPELVRQGMLAPSPREAARQLDDLIQLARWQSVPDAVRQMRQKLTVALECEKLRCKLQKGVPAWAWGAIPLQPIGDAGSAEPKRIAHGQRVWIVAKAKDRVLVATDDPADLRGADLFDKAAGWIEPTRLKSADTEMWFPPDDQLVGVRIWGPLRPPSRDYQLGVITKVEAGKVSVKRYSDNLEQVVDLAAVRVGKLPKGQRVMAFCTDELHQEPATVDEVVAQDATQTTAQDASLPRVKVRCEKGDKSRVEVMAGLSTKLEWLPRRVP